MHCQLCSAVLKKNSLYQEEAKRTLKLSVWMKWFWPKEEKQKQNHLIQYCLCLGIIKEKNKIEQKKSDWQRDIIWQNLDLRYFQVLRKKQVYWRRKKIKLSRQTVFIRKKKVLLFFYLKNIFKVYIYKKKKNGFLWIILSPTL